MADLYYLHSFLLYDSNKPIEYFYPLLTVEQLMSVGRWQFVRISFILSAFLSLFLTRFALLSFISSHFSPNFSYFSYFSFKVRSTHYCNETTSDVSLLFFFRPCCWWCWLHLLYRCKKFLSFSRTMINVHYGWTQLLFDVNLLLLIVKCLFSYILNITN